MGSRLHIRGGFAFILVTVLVTGCLKGQEDYFDMSPSDRISTYLTMTREILVSQEHGWVMPYFHATGGETFCLRFTRDSVYVSAIDAQSLEKGVYQLTPYCGPVLSFDTYLKSFHKYAEASSGSYQGGGGDFEFMISKVESSEIRLKGLRWDQPSFLVPLQTDANTYLQSVAVMAERIPMGTYEGTLNEKSIHLILSEKVSGRDTGRKIQCSIGSDAETTHRYTFSDKGLILADPIIVEDRSIDNFIWKESTRTLEADNIILSFIENN